VVLVALCVTVLLSLALPVMSPLALGWPYRLASLVIGVYLLLVPAVALLRSHEGRRAARLFDRASLYPLAQLVLILVFVLIG